ncbi:MAG TPA: O-antigen ligase family protein [Pyrinomonadaceae bacterium]|jgi:O-antigen ligase
MPTEWVAVPAPRRGFGALPLAGVSAAALAACAGYWAARAPFGAAGAAGEFAPLHLVAVVAGLVGFAFVVRRPEWGLLALVVVLYTNSSEVAVRVYGVPSLLQMLAAAVAAGLALRLLSAPGGVGAARVVLDPLLVPLVVYAAVVLASSLVAEDAALSDERLSDCLKGLVVFLLVTNLVTTRATLRRAVWALVLSGAFLGAVSVFQALTHAYGTELGGFGRVKLAQIVGGLREPRISGPLSDPNFYAQILAALVPFALYRVWGERRLSLRLAALVALGLVGGALAFTYSRGGALAAGLTLGLALVDRRGGLRLVLPGAALLALLLMSVPGQFGGRLETLERLVPDEEEPAVVVHAESSIEQRKLLMRTAWEMFGAHPWLGVGAGNYSEHFDEYAAHVGSATPSYENFAERRYPHNLYLETAAETGLAGLAAFAAVVGGALLSALWAARGFRRWGAECSGALAMSVALALVAYLASSLFLHGHYIQYLWLLVALAAAARRVARAESPAAAEGF